MWRQDGDDHENERLPEGRFTYPRAPHSWGDSNLYIRRTKKILKLTIEHRAAPEPEPLVLELLGDPDTHLEITDRGSHDEDGDDAASNVDEAVLALLQKEPHTSRSLRTAVGVRHAVVQETVERLTGAGLVRREGGKWVVSKQS